MKGTRMESGLKVCGICGGWGTRDRLGRKARPGEAECETCDDSGHIPVNVNLYPRLEEVMQRAETTARLVRPVWESMGGRLVRTGSRRKAS